jgi:hypothetical protein
LSDEVLWEASLINFRRSVKYGFEARVTALQLAGPRIGRLHLPRFGEQGQKLEPERDCY